MKNSKKFKINIPTIAVAVIIISIIASIYVIQLNRTVSGNLSDTISELAEHDQNSIQNYIEETWEDLEYIETKFASYNCKTINDVETLLNIECSNSRFSHIYMVGDDGRVYTDKLLTYDPKSDGQNGRIDLLPYFDNNKNKIVMRFDDKVLAAGISKESILYGIRLKNYSVDGIHMTGLVGISDITNIQNRLIINSFIDDGESRGYSSVIDRNGNYIVNESSSVYLNETDNFFLRIDNARKTEYTSQIISEKMTSSETFNFSFTNSSNTKRIVYCMPFTDTDISWYFLISVEKDVFSDQNRTFLIMSMLMLVCIIAVVVFMLVYVMAAYNKVLMTASETESKSRFLANMSHEIRTPLNGIIGLTYLIEKDVDSIKNGEVIKAKLTKLTITANYLLSLINNILDITKLQYGKIDLSRDIISPEIIADSVWSMQKSQIESRGISFNINYEITVPWIIGDEIPIQRVLMNIVGNAAKFTPEGGSITLTVSQKKHDENHVTTFFTCTDTGCGMSEEFLKHIWDSFSQERRRKDTAESGTGLGMAISKLLVDAMGGEITVESEVGIGSTFTVAIHSEISEPPLQNNSHISENNIQKPNEHLKILLAEDNELNAEILIEILENEEFDVVHAENGQEAVDIFENSKNGEFDVILMDMQMPIMDGCTATEKIRALERADAKTVLIFACTANSFKDDRDQALASGVNYFLTKPIDVDEMLSKIGIAIGKSEDKIENA